MTSAAPSTTLQVPLDPELLATLHSLVTLNAQRPLLIGPITDFAAAAHHYDWVRDYYAARQAAGQQLLTAALDVLDNSADSAPVDPIRHLALADTAATPTPPASC